MYEEMMRSSRSVFLISWPLTLKAQLERRLVAVRIDLLSLSGANLWATILTSRGQTLPHPVSDRTRISTSAVLSGYHSPQISSPRTSMVRPCHHLA